MAFASSGIVRRGRLPCATTSTSARPPPAPPCPQHRARRARMAAAGAPAGATAGLEGAWAAFAGKMGETGVAPPVDEWNTLLDVCLAAREPASKAIWVVATMRETGVKPTAGTYDRVLAVCREVDDRAAAFHLVEQMWQDGVLLGDVELPEGMEDTLRTILPPEAFD